MTSQGSCGVHGSSSFGTPTWSLEMASQKHDGVETEASDAENNPVSFPSIRNHNNNTLARWPLAKYANFIISKKPGGVGTWQERTAGEPHDMWIQITQRRYIQILHADLLLECCSLSDARGEWWAVQRGHNMLFIITANKETSRKFRIRFQSINQEPATNVAHACARHLSRYFTLRDADQQGQVDTDDQRPSCSITLQQLAQSILDPQHSKWPSSYADVGKVPELVPDLVRSCLMDPTFPSLVEAVENAMKKLMSSEVD